MDRTKRTTRRLAKRTTYGLMVTALFTLSAPFTAGAVDVQRVISPGGIEAWLVEDHSLPIIALSLAFRGGSSVDPQGKEGLGELVSNVIDEGAGDIDSQRFQQILQDQSITMRFDAFLDTFTGRIKTLTRNRDQTFEMLRLALTEPRFDREPVERIRAQTLSGLSRRANTPNNMVSRAFWQHAFPDHPYGRPRHGTEASILAITRSDLRDYVKTWFALDKIYLGVVGDIRPDELGRLLDQTFGGLPATSPTIDIPTREPATNGEIIIVEHPVPQSVAIFAQRGMDRDHPDFYAAYLLNHILGGGSFTSRLYAEVREERGLAYSVSTSLSPLDHSALWIGRVGTANANVAESIDIIRQEWASLQANGVTEEELENTRTNVTGAYALSLDSTSNIARTLVGLQVADLPIDYIDRRAAYFAAVTLEDVRRVAAELLDPDSLTIVIVGQPEGIEATR